MSEKYVDLEFPIYGIDVSCEFNRQRKQTTPLGANVRGMEPAGMRFRGGSRSGLVKYIPETVNGDAKVQHINFVVDPSADALISDRDDNDGGDPNDYIDDPSTSNRRRRIPVGVVRRVRRRGSRRMPNRNLPKPLLTITANNLSKDENTTYTFVGNEYSQTGLQVVDVIQNVTLRSSGAAANATEGTYPIVPSRAYGTVGSELTPTFTSLPRKYRISYVNGTFTVNDVPQGGIQFVQAKATLFPQSGSATRDVTFTSAVAFGSLIVVVVTSWTNQPTLAVSDSQGNVYTSAGLPGTAGVLRTYLFYTFAATAGSCTVTVTLDAFQGCAVGVLEYSGVNTTLPVQDSQPGNVSYHTASVNWLTQRTAVGGLERELFIGALGYTNVFSEGIVPAAGFNIRLNNATFAANGSADPMSIFVADAIGYVNGTLKLANVTVGGSGYNATPNVTLQGGGGVNGTVNATIGGGNVTALTVINPGSGYTTAPNLTISGGNGSGAQGRIRPENVTMFGTFTTDYDDYTDYGITFRKA